LKPLGHICYIQENYAEAETLYQQTLQVYQENLSKNHPEIAYSIHRLGNVYFAQKHYKKAEHYYQRSLTIFGKLSESHHFYAACTSIDLGELYLIQGRLRLAQHALQRAHTILGKTLQIDRVDHQEITRCLLLVAEHLADQRELIEARFYYRRALAIGEHALGVDHPLTVCCRRGLEKTLVSTSSV
jgi:tetratricopeptide (TPR) repeat protein